MSQMEGVFHGFEIAAAGMRAELQRSEIVAANISNMHLTGGKDREPYRRRSVVFEEVLADARRGALRGVEGAERLAQGVRVRRVYEDHATPFTPRFDPGHPDADANGFVLMSNVNLFRELVDLAVIERSFQANLAAMRVYRTIVQNSITNIAT
jgi:flagellar basal-body rod protein FlgC